MEVIIDLLQKATSQNPDLIKIAEQHLKSLETERGYFPMLMAIILDRCIDVSIRWLASVCLKNGIDRYWRKNAQNAMTDEERNDLRQKFLLCFDEPVNLVATQIAVIVAKVSRLDWPQWSELFPTLLNVIQRPEDLYQQRGLLILHHVTKTLASKRLIGDQQLFQQMTLSLFPIVVQLWTNYSNAFVQGTKSLNGNLKITLEKCHLCLKILRKLVVYGYKKPGKEREAVNFLQMIFQQFEPFVKCRKCLCDNNDILELCEKYLVTLTKVLADVLDQYPSSFVQFIRPTLECAVVFCFSQEYKDCLFERFTCGLMNLIKTIFTSRDYKYCKASKKTEMKEPELWDVEDIQKACFTPPVLNEIVQQLLCRYFLLTPEEIQFWNEYPEEYAAEKFGESWKFNLRPCAEALFLALFRNFDDVLKPLVLAMQENIKTLKGTDFDTIIKKEAMFNAVGLATFDLYDDISFDQWLTDVVVPELQIVDSNYYIIRRRVIWAIGQWVEVKYPKMTVPLMYSIIVQALDSSENLVVRLTAVNTIKASIETLYFDNEEFEPFLHKIFSSMFTLLKQVHECDLKMSVLHVMTFIIERVPKKVRDHAMSLVGYLQELWATCGEHIMLCCAVISCFNQIVQSLKSECTRLQLILVPMIAFSTDLNNPSHVYWMEDGLILWQSVIENTAVCTPDLLELAQNLFPILDLNKETLERCTSLMESYILFSPKEFLEMYGERIAKTYSSIQADFPDSWHYNFISLMKDALNIFPAESPVLFKPILSYALTSVLEDKGPSYYMCTQLTVLSQVIFHNQSCFANILETFAQKCNQEVNKVFQYLFDVWLKTMPLVTTISQRKMMSLALVRLLTTDCSVVYDNFRKILLRIVEAIHDLTRSSDESCRDILYIDDRDESDDDKDESSEEEKRKSQYERCNPVCTVILADYLKVQMNALKMAVGQTKFEDLMSMVDRETKKHVQLCLLS